MIYSFLCLLMALNFNAKKFAILAATFFCGVVLQGFIPVEKAGITIPMGNGPAIKKDSIVYDTITFDGRYDSKFKDDFFYEKYEAMPRNSRIIFKRNLNEVPVTIKGEAFNLFSYKRSSKNFHYFYFYSPYGAEGVVQFNKYYTRYSIFMNNSSFGDEYEMLSEFAQNLLVR